MVSSLTRQWFLVINITCKLAMTNNTFLCFGLSTTIFKILLSLYVFVSISTIFLIKNFGGALRHVYIFHN